LVVSLSFTASFLNYVFRDPFSTHEGLEGSRNSSLNPYTNKNLPVFVRLTIAPMYSLKNTDESSPDGVLFYGDVVNGKIGDNDMIVSTFKNGYSGTYWYNETSDSFHLLSSVFQASGSANIDLDLAISGVESLMRNAMSSGEQSSSETVFRGSSFELTADSFESAYSYNFNYNVEPEENTAYNPPLFVVRASSNDKWNVLRKQQTIIQVMTVLVQFLSSVGISFLLYQPVYRFMIALSDELNGRSAHARLTKYSSNECIRRLQQFFNKCETAGANHSSNPGHKSRASSVRDTELPSQ
jgi:hypothetical protein